MMPDYVTPFTSWGVTPTLSDGSNLLAMSYMAGGQMAYMPQTQYLTPAVYGAYRTIPMASSTAQPQASQHTGILQSYLAYNRGALPFMAPYTVNTYNPVADQQAVFSLATRRFQDQFSAAKWTLGDFGLRTALGLFGGAPGFVASALLPDVASPYVSRVRDMREIQNLTMSKIISGGEENAAMGMGFNARSARQIDSFIRRSSAGDAIFNDGDYRRLLELGVRNGLFDYANNAWQYKDILKKLRNTMTTMMEVVGSSDFEDLVGEFKRLQTMGASVGQFSTIARKENLYSRMTGLSHRDMVDTYGQQGAVIFTGAGLSGYQGSLSAMANAAMVTYAQRTGLISASSLARKGGISGYTQSLTAQDAGYLDTMKDYLLPYFANEDFTGIDPSRNFESLLSNRNPLQLLGASAARIKDGVALVNYQANRNSLMSDLIDRFGVDTVEMSSAFLAGRQAGFSGPEALRIGLQLGGLSAEAARDKAAWYLSDDFQEQVMREAAKARQKRREERELENNPVRQAWLGIKKGWTGVSEATWGALADSHARRTEIAEAHKAGMAVSTNAVLLAQNELGAMAGASITDNELSAAELEGVLGPTIRNESSGRLDARNFRVLKDGSVQPHFGDYGGASYGGIQFNAVNIVRFLKANKQFGSRLEELGVTEQVLKDVADTYGKGKAWHRGEKIEGRQAASVITLGNAVSSLMEDDSFRRAYLQEAKHEYYDNLSEVIRRRAEQGNASAQKVRELFGDERMRRFVFDIAVPHGVTGAANLLESWAKKFSSPEELRQRMAQNPFAVMEDISVHAPMQERYRERLRKTAGELLRRGSGSRVSRETNAFYASMRRMRDDEAAHLQRILSESREPQTAENLRQELEKIAPGNFVSSDDAGTLVARLRDTAERIGHEDMLFTQYPLASSVELARVLSRTVKGEGYRGWKKKLEENPRLREQVQAVLAGGTFEERVRERARTALERSQKELNLYSVRTTEGFSDAFLSEFLRNSNSSGKSVFLEAMRAEPSTMVPLAMLQRHLSRRIRGDVDASERGKLDEKIYRLAGQLGIGREDMAAMIRSGDDRLRLDVQGIRVGKKELAAKALEEVRLQDTSSLSIEHAWKAYRHYRERMAAFQLAANRDSIDRFAAHIGVTGEDLRAYADRRHLSEETRRRLARLSGRDKETLESLRRQGVGDTGVEGYSGLRGGVLAGELDGPSPEFNYADTVRAFQNVVMASAGRASGSHAPVTDATMRQLQQTMSTLDESTRALTDAVRYMNRR